MTKGQTIIPWRELAEYEGYQNIEIYLRHRYLVQRWSSSRLERHLGVCMQSIRDKMAGFNIPIRPSRGGNNNPTGITGRGIDSAYSVTGV